MFLCYIDESGVSQVPGNTSHFILSGLAIPIYHWKTCEKSINKVKSRYDLECAEIHAGWLARKYLEQNRINDFSNLSRPQRRTEVERYRNNELLRLQRINNSKLYHQTKKNYEQTKAYIHLTYEERISFLKIVSKVIGKWGFARLFAECIDKIFIDPRKTGQSIDEQAFEQVISRFEQYLQIYQSSFSYNIYGLIIHDNNPTIEKKHTELMKSFHKRGTLWTKIEKIIEYPLFVNSQLTSMVQLADICAYSLRRYLENGETYLFENLFQRADRKEGIAVGVRHFTEASCKCIICNAHRPQIVIRQNT